MSIPFVKLFLMLLGVQRFYFNKSVKHRKVMYLLCPKIYIYRVLLFKQDLKHDEDTKQGPSYEEFMCQLGPYD
jgi:hypothetical protein